MTLREMLQRGAALSAEETVQEFLRFIDQGTVAIEVSLPDRISQKSGRPYTPFMILRSPGSEVVKHIDDVFHRSAFLHANTVSPERLQALPTERWHGLGKDDPLSIHDPDICALNLFSVDLDPNRATSKQDSATSEEMAKALHVARDIYALLTSIVSEQSVGMRASGNGWWVDVCLDHLDLKNTEHVRRGIAALDRMFSSPDVGVDVKTADPRRLSPLPGTIKRKGTSTAERPHRRVWFAGPTQRRPLSAQQLIALVDEIEKRAPKPKPKPVTLARPTTYDGPKDTLAREQALAIPLHSVYVALGQVASDGHLICPACGRSKSKSTVYWESANILKCFRDKCPGPTTWNAIDTVMHHVFGLPRTEKTGFVKAVNWLADTFKTREIETIVPIDTTPMEGLWLDDDRYTPGVTIQTPQSSTPAAAQVRTPKAAAGITFRMPTK